MIAPGPTYTPVRAWVLAAGQASRDRPRRDQRCARRGRVRPAGRRRSHPFIFTVPLVRVEQMIGYLARRNFLWPATFDDERVDRAERSGYDWAPWAGELTPTLFTLPGMLAVDFTGVTRDDVKPQTLNGLVEVAQSLADVARISADWCGCAEADGSGPHREARARIPEAAARARIPCPHPEQL